MMDRVFAVDTPFNGFEKIINKLTDLNLEVFGNFGDYIDYKDYKDYKDCALNILPKTKFGEMDNKIAALKEKYFVDIDKKILKNFSSCFDDLVSLSNIICKIFQSEKAKLTVVKDEGNSYLVVQLPCSEDVEDSYNKFEEVKNIWFEKANQKTLNKVLVDLV